MLPGALRSRRSLATAALAVGLVAARPRPALPRPPAAEAHAAEALVAEALAADAEPVRALAAEPAGFGSKSEAEGDVFLGVVPARGVLPLGEIAEGEGIAGVTLWPPAKLWLAGQGPSLRLEHGPLSPQARYRLELAWAGGRRLRAWFETAPLYEVIARGPEVGRVDPQAAVWARFGVEVDRASVEASFHMEPPVTGQLDWTDEHTVRFKPDKTLPYGVLHRVTVGGRSREGAALATASWTFRTLIPPPLKIRPGEGAPAVFTFDDGTNDLPQAWALLDLLRKHEVRSILFPTGRWAKAHPEYIERALREGHRICNHSATHPHLSDLPDTLMEAEIVGGAGHGSCNLLRPPSMATSKRVERVAASLGYRLYLWDVDSRDWEGLPPEDIVNRVLARVKPGAVLLFHMHGAGTLQALPKLFEVLRREGYRLTYEGANGAPDAPEGEGPGDSEVSAP